LFWIAIHVGHRIPPNLMGEIDYLNKFFVNNA
jgi:hypothetical protein